MDILIFDDDAYLSEMVAALAGDAGYSVEKSLDGLGALDKVKRLKPRLVVTDIMMPGIDGLTLCRQIRSDPETRGVHVIVYSGRPYGDDGPRALAAGAAAHFSKGALDFEGLLRTVRGLLGAASAGAPAPAAAAGAPAFRARVWGCRGPGAGAATNCVSVEAGPHLAVLDAGTGLSRLAASLVPADPNVWLLLSQAGRDRVAGLSALGAWLPPGGSLRAAGPGDLSAVGRSLEALPPESSARRGGAAPLAEGRFQLWPTVVLDALWTRHPEMALAFSLSSAGKRIVYCADNELEDPDDVQSDFTEKIGRFVRGADLLIHDARYSDAQYAAAKNRGHASPKSVVDLAVREGVRRLLLYNFAPDASDADIETIAADAAARVESGHWSVKVEAARPGLTLDV